MNDISQISNIQSESGIIGTLICHPDYLAHTEYLQPSYFFGTENACWYWAIRELFNEGVENMDAFNLSNKLQSHKGVNNAINKFNLPSVQEMITLYVAAARNSIEEYKMLVEDVITLAFKRDMVKSLDAMKGDCFNSKVDLDQLNDSVYRELDQLTERYLYKDDVHLLGEEVDDIWDEIVSRRRDDGNYGIPSKYKVFSKYFTYEPGELVVVQASMKKGKSALLLNEAVDKLKNGKATLVVDTEMRKPIYLSRMLALLTGLDVNQIKRGTYDAKGKALIESKLDWIKEQPFVYIYDPSMTMPQLYSTCKILKNKIGLEFVVYDYIKSNERSTGDNYNALGAMCDFLKNKIAGELNLSVLSAAQLNRNGEIADSYKINMYASVAIKWGLKDIEMISKDGEECGNAWAKVYVNRLGEAQQDDDEEDYLDFKFYGSTMTIQEVVQHSRADGL